ncbi:MAG: hypothetical protein KDB00_13245 [Planctomycetales bacterium]|nr:hypothetical protein [Planctomycetales bacterium]
MNNLVESADEYSSAGYCVFRDVLTPDEISNVRANLDELIRDMPEKMTVCKHGHG